MVRSYRELREAIDKKDRGLREKILVSMHHERRRFVERVDFITTPGYLKGGDSREKAGLTEGGYTRLSPIWGSLALTKRAEGCALKHSTRGLALRRSGIGPASN